MSATKRNKLKILTSLYLAFIITSLINSTVSAQNSSDRLMAKFISEPINLDGVLDEAVWETADSSGEFWQYFPADTVSADYKTEIKFLYDETTLYAAIRAEAANAKYVVSTLRRDFRGSSNDNVSMMFDTFRDGNIAFLFGVTPYGVQRDALVSDGGSVVNTTWDVKWQAKSTMFDDHYIVEIAIPLNSLKFREGDTFWRFQCYRWNLQSNEQSALSRVPQNQQLSNLAFMGELVFEKPLKALRRPLSIIPYINTLHARDFTENEVDNKIKLGGDAKIAIGNGMNLDLTLNPDFSNVEVDDIFTNLTRFELFLPEKRQFFIDNNDLFESFGSIYRDASPFFSRRIGLARDINGNLIENRILGGVRLSGKLDENWRLGLLNIQTAEDRINQIASNNNSMFAMQRKVFSRSNLGFFVVNRQAFGNPEFQYNNDKYNRVIGTDFNLASKNNVWSGKFYLHKSLQPDNKLGNFSSQATVGYNTRKYTVITDWVYVDQDFKADLGFVPRTDIVKAGNGVIRKFWPGRGMVNRHSVGLISVFFWRPSLDFKLTDKNLMMTYESEFKNLSTLNVRLAKKYIFLTNGFDPTRTPGAEPLPGNIGYRFNDATITYESNMAQLLTFNFTSNFGQFFNGNFISSGGSLSYRVQPWAQFSLALNYDRIRLPDPQPDADLWLLSPKVDITFSKKLFWSTLVQYSNQRNNFGVNSRLQWRFAQLSDLYLVYNDNYIVSPFEPRYRSINLKLTYWLNI